jgi:hypothetical protein
MGVEIQLFEVGAYKSDFFCGDGCKEKSKKKKEHKR